MDVYSPFSSSLHRTGELLVVSGPSGVGKDTLLDRVFAQLHGVVRSVSATTRPPRPGEVDGSDYYFLTHAEFEKQIAENTFLEYARYGDNYYGTPHAKVDALREQGTDVILKIEVQGARQVRRMAKEAVLIFIAPPSLEALEHRLRSRGTDTEEKVQKRLEIARHELSAACDYDFLIINDHLETAVENLKTVILAHRFRIRT